MACLANRADAGERARIHCHSVAIHAMMRSRAKHAPLGITDGRTGRLTNRVVIVEPTE